MLTGLWVYVSIFLLQTLSHTLYTHVTSTQEWKLIEAASSLCVGPNSTYPCQWWANSLQDATQTRECLFDDRVVFSSDGNVNNGNVNNVHGDETWLEPFQNDGVAGCGAFETNNNWEGQQGTWYVVFFSLSTPLTLHTTIRPKSGHGTRQTMHSRWTGHIWD